MTSTYDTPGPGELSVRGDFYSDESILLRYNENGTDKTVTGEISDDFEKVTFKNLPAGGLSFVLLVSCDGHGQQQLITGFQTIE